MAGAARAHTLGVAVDRAIDFVLGQAETRFAETRHEMRFPRAAGFTGPGERQSSDVFARAVLGSVLCDLADLDEGARARELRCVARREADYVAGRKLTRSAGGWSYFPDLPELPPDADSLAAALSLFARAAPEHLPLCRVPIDLVLSGTRADGSFETWILSPDDDDRVRARIAWGVKYCWGSGSDIEVIAHFYRALALADPNRWAEAIARGAAFLANAQDAGGLWVCTWYADRAYGAGLCLDVLRHARADSAIELRAHAAACDAQRTDGTWGLGRPIPLETALSLWTLRTAPGAAGRAAFDRGAAALADLQEQDGSWEPSPWIRMPIGRAAGQVTRVATYYSVTITSAFCARSLAAARRRDS